MVQTPHNDLYGISDSTKSMLRSLIHGLHRMMGLTNAATEGTDYNAGLWSDKCRLLRLMQLK